MVKETKSIGVWQTIAISTACSVISAIILLGITKTDQAAPKDYVDKRFESIQNKLDQKADKDDIIEIKSTLTTMDARLYDLWANSQPKSQKQSIPFYILLIPLFSSHSKSNNHHKNQHSTGSWMLNGWRVRIGHKFYYLFHFLKFSCKYNN